MPIIGVTSFPDIETKVHRTNTTYIKAIRDAGGIPLQLPTVNAEEEAREMLAAVDGLLLPGGPDMNPLLFGEEPHMSTYYLTRKGQGQSVERRKAYKYQSLASGFRGRKADPFMVYVEPKPEDAPMERNSHEGQEFNMVTEGSMELVVGKKTLVLNEGDSIYFDATQPHGMRALNGKPVRFLAIIF